MEVKNIRPSTTHFTALNYDYLNCCSKEVTKAIKNSPALKALDKRYDGFVSAVRFGSGSNPSKSYFGLFIRDLEPSNILSKAIDKLIYKLDGATIQYNSRTTTENEFIQALMNLKSKTFLK